MHLDDFILKSNTKDNFGLVTAFFYLKAKGLDY